jgi:hypothetical protein
LEVRGAVRVQYKAVPLWAVRSSAPPGPQSGCCFRAVLSMACICHVYLCIIRASFTASSILTHIQILWTRTFLVQ